MTHTTTRIEYSVELQESRRLCDSEQTAHVTLYRTVTTYEHPTGPGESREPRVLEQVTKAVDGLTYQHPKETQP